MKLTYWYAECLGDHACYSIRQRTKRDAIQARSERISGGNYGPVIKVTVKYRDGFDLVEQCMSEGNGYWELDNKLLKIEEADHDKAVQRVTRAH